MSRSNSKEYEEIQEENDLEFENSDENFSDIPQFIPDDQSTFVATNRQIEHMLESLTRIGGEVCRLRSEVDGLLEQNSTLSEVVRRLKDVIGEKGLIDLDDFQLACDVFEESSGKNAQKSFVKKIAH